MPPKADTNELCTALPLPGTFPAGLPRHYIESLNFLAAMHHHSNRTPTSCSPPFEPVAYSDTSVHSSDDEAVSCVSPVSSVGQSEEFVSAPDHMRPSNNVFSLSSPKTNITSHSELNNTTNHAENFPKKKKFSVFTVQSLLGDTKAWIQNISFTLCSVVFPFFSISLHAVAFIPYLETLKIFDYISFVFFSYLIFFSHRIHLFSFK